MNSDQDVTPSLLPDNPGCVAGQGGQVMPQLLQNSADTEQGTASQDILPTTPSSHTRNVNIPTTLEGGTTATLASNANSSTSTPAVADTTTTNSTDTNERASLDAVDVPLTLSSVSKDIVSSSDDKINNNTSVFRGTETQTTISVKGMVVSRAPHGSQRLSPPVEGVNGYGRPQEATKSREAPSGLSTTFSMPPKETPLDQSAGQSDPIGGSPLPTPLLRSSDISRERERVSNMKARLRTRPAKRKLWDVDHDQVQRDLAKELDLVAKEDEQRFNERWEELGPMVNANAPSFYYSQVSVPESATRCLTTPPSASTVRSSARSSVTPPPGPRPSITDIKHTHSEAKRRRTTSYPPTAGTAKSKRIIAPASSPGASAPSSDDDRKSAATPKANPHTNESSVMEVLTDSPRISSNVDIGKLSPNRRDETSPVPSLSGESPVSEGCSSHNVSASSSKSSSGVSSAESTPLQDASPTGGTTLTPKEASSQRSSSRPNRLRRSRRTGNIPSRRHLRM